MAVREEEVCERVAEIWESIFLDFNYYVLFDKCIFSPISLSIILPYIYYVYSYRYLFILFYFTILWPMGHKISSGTIYFCFFLSIKS